MDTKWDAFKNSLIITILIGLILIIISAVIFHGFIAPLSEPVKIKDDLSDAMLVIQAVITIISYISIYHILCN